MDPTGPAIGAPQGEAPEGASIRAATGRTASATITLAAAVAFIAATTALGLGLEATARSVPGNGWRLRGTVAEGRDAGSRHPPMGSAAREAGNGAARLPAAIKSV